MSTTHEVLAIYPMGEIMAALEDIHRRLLWAGDWDALDRLGHMSDDELVMLAKAEIRSH